MENTCFRHKANRLLVDPLPEDNVFRVHMRLQFGLLFNVEHLELTCVYKIELTTQFNGEKFTF